MVIDFPGGLFGQSDVRETETGVPGKTTYLSIPATAFRGNRPDVDDIQYGGAPNFVRAFADGISLLATVELPHGATITSCIVHGNAAATAESWTLERTETDGLTSVSMSSANIGTADTTITNPIINNQIYSYTIFTGSIDTDDRVHGAFIIYTT